MMLNNPYYDVPNNLKTPWFPKEISPIRAGVYHVTCEATKKFGGASYEFWTGQRWIPNALWGQMSERPGFEWQGLNKQMTKLPDNHILSQV